VGDSKAFVVSVDQKRKVQVVYSTKPHKPNDPLERQRIEGMGGQVQEPPAPQYSARVMIPLGGPFMDVLGLAMSRSLGDFEGHPYGIIADPTTDVITLTELDSKLDYMVILASDGLLDRVSELEIASQMAASQLLTPKSPISSLQAAEQLILQSSQAWMRDFIGASYRDDISLAVQRLRI
jgi:serine/threonine protein phosphatase PrpC